MTNPQNTAAASAAQNKSRPPPLPPKVPFNGTNSSRTLSDHLQLTKPSNQRGISVGSSVASDSSRDSLRREVIRRRNSLTFPEYNFLQDIMANGTEIEVTLAERRLQDPSLCFDVNSSQEEENEPLPQQQQQQQQPKDVLLEVAVEPTKLSPKRAVSLGELSMESAADKPPDRPMPKKSPPDLTERTEVPSAEELYPEEITSNDSKAANENEHHSIHVYTNNNILNHATTHMVDELEQTPLVRNYKPQKSLEGALSVPMMLRDSTSNSQNTAASTSSHLQQHHPSLPRPAPQRRRSNSNPLLGQLWKAHEKGLALTPQQSSKRILLRREQSLSSVGGSPVRQHYRPPSMAAARRSSSTISNTGSDNRPLLNHKELMKLKQWHNRSLSELDPDMLMRNLAISSTDSSSVGQQQQQEGDISALLLPTDEEIFRRSERQQQQEKQNNMAHSKPPPPRPFRESINQSKESTTTTSSASGTAAATTTPGLRRMVSEGATTSAPHQIQRRPSILRRMTSDSGAITDDNNNNNNNTTGPNKSVSFSLDHTVQQQQQQQEQQTASIMPLFADNLPEIIPSDMDDSLSTFGSEHHSVSEVLRGISGGRTESCSSIPSLHHGTPVLSEGSSQQQQSQLPKQFAMHRMQPDEAKSRRESMDSSFGMDSVASLNLHRAHPIRQDSIASTAEGWQACDDFQRDIGWSRRESQSSMASLNLHIATPIRQESVMTIGDDDVYDDNGESAAFRRRDSNISVASLHKAAPIRQESIASNAEGLEAVVAFRQQIAFAHPSLGRRDSMDSLASLNLHRARPIIRQESIGSTAEGLDAAEAFRQKIASERWGKRDSSNSVISRQDSNISLLNDSIILGDGDSLCVDAGDAFRDQAWDRRDSSVASLNLHHANPIRQDSIAASMFDRQDSMASVSSLNLHKAHPIQFDRMAAALDILRNQGSAIPEKGSIDSCDDDKPESTCSIQPAKPLRQESIVSTVSGKEAKEALREQFTDTEQEIEEAFLPTTITPAEPLGQDSITSTISGTEAKEALRKQFSDQGGRLREASSGTAISSISEVNSPPFRRDSIASIPSLHPARPVRQESIASTAAGEEAKEAFEKQFQNAIVYEEWQGDTLPENWEDKKEDDDAYACDFDDKIEPKKPVLLSRARPVMMRHASASEYDEEGMEVAAIDEEEDAVTNKNEMEVSTIVEEETDIANHQDEEGTEVTDIDEEEESSESVVEETPDAGVILVSAAHRSANNSDDTELRQNGYQHFPDSLVSFGINSSKSEEKPDIAIVACASFDETKSVDRFRGVFRGALPRSLSEDELPKILSAHCKPKPLTRGQSEATVFPTDMDSTSWEMDTVEGDYDGWDVLHDEYAVGYGYHSLPFRIIGTGADDIKAQPHVLSPPLMESLQSFFPIAKTSDNFWLKYSLVRDGASLHTLMQHARGAKYSILALETTDGEVFGAFTSEPWRKTWSFFGGGESFLWRMRSSRRTPCFSIIDQAQMESEIDVYPFTGFNHCIQLCTHNKIAVGGGSPEHTEEEEKRDDKDNAEEKDDDDDKDINNVGSGEISIKDHEWGYGLELHADLLHGSSSPCVTFGSPSLSNTHGDGTVFEIVNLELWTLTPCSNLMDAEKLELGKLFLEFEQSPSNNDTGGSFE